MAFDYSEILPDVENAIAEFGRAATLIKPGTPSGTAYNPTPGTPTEHAINLVQLEYSMTNRDASLIQAGDKLWLISTAGETPELTHTIRDNAVVYQIVDVQPLMPGDTTMIFEVQGRK